MPYVIDLNFCKEFEGKVLGTTPNEGECAAGVEIIFLKKGIDIGLTPYWTQGVKVRDSDVIKPGTAIASFKNGKYWHHAAIYISKDNTGIQVYDQWVGQVWHQRPLPYNKKNDGMNDGDNFYIIE